VWPTYVLFFFSPPMGDGQGWDCTLVFLADNYAQCLQFVETLGCSEDQHKRKRMDEETWWKTNANEASAMSAEIIQNFKFAADSLSPTTTERII